MAIGPRLELRQSQSLVMTPQLQQAIRLLALSNQEIEGFIAEELERNPLLETGGGLESGGSDSEDRADALTDGLTDSEPERRDAESAGADRLIDGSANNEALDIDWHTETFHHDGPGEAAEDWRDDSRSGGLDGALGLDRIAEHFGEPGEGIDFDGFAASGISLHDHLAAQAGETLSGNDLAIALALIGRIDACGYFDAPMLETAEALGVPFARCEALLSVIHSFDPAGVGARSLAECLAIQARQADRYDPAMACLIDHLDLLAKGALPQLKRQIGRICRVDDDDLADMIRELRGYDPKPGLAFERSETSSVTPDVFVERRKAGWVIEINASTLPRILINRRYHAELARGAAAKSKAWLSDCMASANWLIRALDQRQRTIIKVATEIVRRQEGFFLHGVTQMKPLTLKQVADTIGMHESTVSRVTSNKYLSCARGIFEFKYFFSSGIQSAEIGGDAVSAEAVKAGIKALIDAEGDKILSDDTLVDLLNAKGFDIARRTVAKYREAMGIGSSVQRRRQRRLGG